MRKFKLASLIFLFILLTNISFAQECDSTCCSQPNNQLQFQFVGGFSLSYVKMLSHETGLRFKIGFWLNGSGGNKTNKNENFYGNQVSTNNHKSDDYSSFQNVDLAFNYLQYFQLNQKIRLYLGAGPYFNYYRRSSESNYDSHNIQPNNVSTYKNNYENYGRTLSIGLQFVAGIDLELTNSLALLAEYSLEGTHSWFKENYDSNSFSEKTRNMRNSDGTSWNYNLTNIKLGIAYRF